MGWRGEELKPKSSAQLLHIAAAAQQTGKNKSCTESERERDLGVLWKSKRQSFSEPWIRWLLRFWFPQLSRSRLHLHSSSCRWKIVTISSKKKKNPSTTLFYPTKQLRWLSLLLRRPRHHQQRRQMLSLYPARMTDVPPQLIHYPATLHQVEGTGGIEVWDLRLILAVLSCIKMALVRNQRRNRPKFGWLIIKTITCRWFYRKTIRRRL